jgi:hypothetical protein
MLKRFPMAQVLDAELDAAMSAKQPGEKSASWRDGNMTQLEKQGVAWCEVRPPAVVQNSPWFDVLCPRERAVLGVELQRRPDAKAVDVGQSMGRERTSLVVENQVIFGAITPSQRLLLVDPEWSGGPPRLLLGSEALRLQGFPIEHCQPAIDRKQLKFSDSFLFGLAGNCFHGVSYWSVLIAILVALPTVSEQTVREADQCDDDALQIAASCMAALADDDEDL